ncbi:MAG: CPBP family intramembrane metalloprotease [Muribaculum sp.]|nr:CPBP family intramembrane metalloprotease [Muribaculum sp.]
MEEWRESKKIFSRLGWCYIAGTVEVYLMQTICSYLIQTYRPEWMNRMEILLIFSGIIVYALGMPLILLLTHGMEKTVPERHKMKWWQFLLAFIMCYALIYVSNLAGNLITMIVGAAKGSSVENDLIGYVTGGNMFVNFVLMVVVAPIVEEYVFRKTIVDRTVKYGQGLAIAASGLMFGLFHGNLNQFAYAVGLGAFFAFLYIKTGNLKITIALHAMVNFLGSVVAGGLMKLLQFDALVRATERNDEEAIMELVMNNLGAWLLFGLYALCLFAVVVTGVILFIVYFKRFRLEPGQVQVPEGEKFNTLIVNPGMLMFCCVWIVLIVLQLLM